MPLDLETDVMVAVVRAAFAMRRTLQDRFRDAGAGVTVAEFGFLGLLVREDGQRVGEVAEFMALDRTTVTRLADGLVKKGHIARRVDEADRRMVRLHTTPRGRRLFARLLPLRQALLDGATAGLTKTRRADLVAVLTDMRQNLLDSKGSDR